MNEAEKKLMEDEELVEISGEENNEVEETEDGGAILHFDEGAEEDAESTDHFSNIVDEIDSRVLLTTVSSLLDKIEIDMHAREKRDKLYEEGLRRTGLGDDAPGGAQFTGASKVVHPLLIESCIDFSARAMKELFPPQGPVRTKVFGEKSPDTIKKAQGKSEFMNWQLVEQMPEFRSELEQLLTQLPLGGSQYMKLLRDNRRRRTVAEFIPIDDVFLPFSATNFYAAERKTHRMYVTEQTFEERMRDGVYRDIGLSTPSTPEFSAASKANDKIEGKTPSPYNEDGLRTVYEVQMSGDLEESGEFCPYIITIDESSGEALSVQRNWAMGDENYEPLSWIVEFPMIPWRGAYAIGLTHLIGGLSGASTGALRALLDSAHINNFPTALKLKGGPNGQTINLVPTQLAEIDAPPGVDDIRKLTMPLPFNGPSATLYQLLGFLIDAGKGVVQTSFEKLSDASPNMPVGTTLALIEQGMVVFSSIHQRLHKAMDMVLKIMHRINASYLTEEDIKNAGDFDVKPEDFDGPIDIIPVSDPNVFSETQRFAQVQAVLQRADSHPQMYDAEKVEKMFLQQLKVPDDILIKKGQEENLDPASENVAAVMGRQLYVLPRQDHIAHMMVHLKFAMSPVFGMNNVMKTTYIPQIIQHLRDHMLNYYMTEAQRAVEMAESTNIMPKGDAKEQAQLITEVQAAAEAVLGNVSQLIDQLQAMMPPPQGPMPPPDNSLAVAQLGSQTQLQIAQGAQALKDKEIQINAENKQLATRLQFAKLERDKQVDQMKMMEKQFQEQQENMRTAAELQARERMNSADNQTAIDITAAEIQSGEKVGVSTGTGINP